MYNSLSLSFGHFAFMVPLCFIYNSALDVLVANKREHDESWFPLFCSVEIFPALLLPSFDDDDDDNDILDTDDNKQR